tara:strand:- start:15 stop:239 length:225 start_codon:yes stop_codon:yes gene_type:complete
MMLTCLVISGSLWIGDANIMFPTQGTFYFHKFQQNIRVFASGGSRHGGFIIPDEFDAETIGGVFEKCSKEKSGD